MKSTIYFAFAALFYLSPVLAQVSATPERFSAQAVGYLERARIMNNAGNYNGVIDQLRHLDTQNVKLSPAQAEEYTYLLANAYYMRDDDDCLRLLTQFCKNYPASPLAPKAALAIGDFYFFQHEWSDALNAYNKCDLQRLNRDEKYLYTYREMLCEIKTGHFSEARAKLMTLSNQPGYENAYNFYSAYLDYIDGNFNSAYDLFKMVPDGISGLDAGYYMAQIEYSRGQYEKVIDRGSRLLKINAEPELSPEINRIVGLSYFKLGRLEQARKYLTEYFATTQGTPEPDALYAMGAIDYSEGRYNAAIRNLMEVSDRDDEIGQGAWLYLGQCYLKQDNPSAAAIAFEKASKMNFDRNVSETALYNYVTALTQGGKIPFSSSSEMLEQFVKRFPNSKYVSEVELYLTTAYYNDHNYGKALKYVESIKNPSAEILKAKQKILYELGVENISNGRPDAAIPYLQQCVSLKRYDSNVSAQASLWLGDAFTSLGRYKEAIPAYRDYLKDDTSRDNRALAYYDLAYALYKTSNYSEAAKNFSSALSEKPALNTRLADDARIRLGDCLYYTGKYPQAIEMFSKAIDNNATDSDYALYRRAVLHGLAGDVNAKINDIGIMEASYPSSRWLSKGLLEKAVAYEETGQPDLAADAYKKRLSLTDEVDIDELLRMASAMNKTSRWADLLDVADRISHAGGLEADELAEIEMYKADALTGLGRSDEAVPIYMTLAVNPNSLQGAKAAVLLAENDLKNQNYEAARQRMEDFTDLGSTHQYWLARGFIALADAYRGLGQTNLAREYISSLQENYPGNEDDIKSMINTRLKNWK